MKARIFFSVIALFDLIIATGQNQSIDLTFTGVNNLAHAQLDSIKVINRYQSGDTVLYWPDTVLSLYYTGITAIPKEENAFRVFQNYPNPVSDQTTISLYVPEKDIVSIIITDILGMVIIKTDRLLGKGNHSFRFTPGNGSAFFFIAEYKGNCCSIKILKTASSFSPVSLLCYIEREVHISQLKAEKNIQSFPFTLGNELLYIGYVNGLQSGIVDNPLVNKTYSFQFATNIPCPGTPTVSYAGQVYNTIQIFSQCWLKENLNVGTMIDVAQSMTDNNVIEKYCYNNKQDSCVKYGGLYQWDESMQYTLEQRVQGICPAGWHLPTNEEWKILEGAIDSLYGIGDTIWDVNYFRGYNVATNIKTTTGWNYNGNGTDLFGFSGLPGGCRFESSPNYYGYTSIGADSYWWSSTGNYSGAWCRWIVGYNPSAYSYRYAKEYAFSVRCILDN